MKQRSSPSFPLLLLGLAMVITATLVAGCDSSIDPFGDSDVRYSIFARFDVAATQNVVRVEDLRDGVPNGVPAESRLTVRLVNERTGETTGLQVGNRDTISGRSVRNHIYDGPVLPATNYRIEVEGDDGSTASAAFETPTSLPRISIDSLIVCEEPTNPGVPIPTGFSFQMSPNGGDKLVRASVRYITAPVIQTYPKIQNIASEYSLSDSVSYKVDAYEDLQRVALEILGDDFDGFALPPPVVPVDVDVIYGVAGPDFPESDILLADLEELTLPGNYSNVDGGLGFVFGAISDTMDVPFNPEFQLCE